MIVKIDKRYEELLKILSKMISEDKKEGIAKATHIDKNLEKTLFLLKLSKDRMFNLNWYKIKHEDAYNLGFKMGLMLAVYYLLKPKKKVVIDDEKK